MALNYFIVDAFTHGPFTGNPAAVLVLEGPASDAWMQAVAAEINLSETCFLWPSASSSPSHWRLRWFSPRCEVILCGHGTLASAHVLWRTGRANGATLTFDAGPQHFALRCHLLTHHRDRREQGREEQVARRRTQSHIALDFPANHAEATDIDGPLRDLLPSGIQAAGRSTTVAGTLLVELDRAEALYHFSPDFNALRAATRDCLLLTARSDRDDSDIVSRFFAPHAGVDEDPVTGSAHCMLAPWWQIRLRTQTLRFYQASPRGGTVEASWDGGQTVRLSGRVSDVVAGRWEASIDWS